MGLEHYMIEAKGPTISGTVTLGGRKDIQSKALLRMTHVKSAIRKINLEREKERKLVLACQLRYASRIGPPSQPAYDEDAYELEFTLNPLISERDKEEFLTAIQEYADRLGYMFQQGQMHIRFMGTDYLLGKKEK